MTNMEKLVFVNRKHNLGGSFAWKELIRKRGLFLPKRYQAQRTEDRHSKISQLH